MKPKRIRPMTVQRAKERAQYNKRVKVWLTEPGNALCRVCKLLGLEPRTATQCHHTHGRIGDLLLFEQWWVPVSAFGHDWIERNRQHAVKLGLLCPHGQYNTPPST